PPSPEPHLHAAALRLVDRYGEWFSTPTIHRLLLDSHRRLAARASIHAHLPILAERLTRERLEGLARSEGHLPTGVPHVLFVCGRNTGRSQLAAAILAHRAGDRVRVSSAGTDPAPAPAPEVLRSLAEVGIEAEAAFPRPLTEEVIGAADVVVTMGCVDACPVLPGRRYLNWPLPAPEGAPPHVVRAVRNAVTAHVEELLPSLLPTPTGGR
ncbi:low molecular weight phosphatase family protein, partial [Streptomyces alkaliphilus]|uniref:arsenate-mycothiol transferase ArsC n=1 Tax=Streptomyces alkaliphilus TaxID=1472722 RepID=UPI00117D0092